MIILKVTKNQGFTLCPSLLIVNYRENLEKMTVRKMSCKDISSLIALQENILLQQNELHQQNKEIT